ncbi:unnamed protein product [Darwinula stevensoni]|uniref:BUD13 homolog n=1 Tax=Darwinula stevensoni TaxID=69355 RepID=A0A7R8XB55_9CRUS|nr:unnamed protein product [Darwinula stevensoni]CAG0887363.1 unnamed protein product [Darwinula stevensoni]
MAGVVSQKEYLKKYLKSTDKKKKKKAHKKNPNKASRCMIVDDDVNLRDLKRINDDSDESYTDDLPQVVALIDERPKEIVQLEQFKNSGKWKVLSSDSPSESENPSHSMKCNEVHKSCLSDPKTYIKEKYPDSNMPSSYAKIRKGQETPKMHGSDHGLLPTQQRSQLSGETGSARKQDSNESGIKKNERSWRTENQEEPGGVLPPNQPEPNRTSSHRKQHDPNSHPFSLKKMGGDLQARKSDSDCSTSCPPDSDLSPPRSSGPRGKESTKTRFDSKSDLSPSGQSGKESWKRRHDSDSDLSPPRSSGPHGKESTKTRLDSKSDLSPSGQSGRESRKRRHDSDSDLSPPRSSGPRRKESTKTRFDSKSDLSPSGQSGKESRKRRHDSDSDLSPPRPSGSHGKMSTKTSHDSKSDDGGDGNSLLKGDKHLLPSLVSLNKAQSKPSNRREKFEPMKSSDPGAERQAERKVNAHRLEKTLEGKSAGLQSAEDLARELESFKKTETMRFRELSDEVSGRTAKTVTRMKMKTKDEQEKEALEAQKKAEREKKYKQWGQGLAQEEAKQQQLEEMLHEMSKPMARYADDPDLEAHLRAQERAGDPMLAYIRKKKAQSNSQGSEKPRYRGPEPPPNRFGIWPGHRWDGVDRSNGFEKRLFETQTNRKAREEEAYKWSIEDM